MTQGDTVHIYSTVSNEETSQFVGRVLFEDGITQLGSVAITLAAGDAQTVSISWIPLAGAHTITAEIEDNADNVVEKESQIFTVNPPPQPVGQGTSDSNTAAVESSQQIDQDISNVSPQAAQAAEPAFAVIDGLRSDAANALSNQLTNAEQKLSSTAQPGIVEGAETQNPTVTNPWGEFWFVLWTVYVYALTILLYIINNAAVFYPVLVIVVLYLLYKTYRWTRRPSYY